MSLSRSFSVALVLLAITLSPNKLAFGQETVASKSSSKTGDEIFVVVEGGDTVDITAEPYDTSLSTVTGTATSGSLWSANTNCSHSTTVNLKCNKLYDLTLAIDDDIFTFQWMTCESGYGFSQAVHGFYCITDNPSTAGFEDVTFTWDGQSLEIDATGFGVISDDLLPTASDWVWPHDIGVFCGYLATCTNKSETVAYFLTPQTGSSNYKLSAATVAVPSSETWTWDDKTIKFASGAVLTVEGTLDADGTTLTSGSSWGGITFESGSGGGELSGGSKVLNVDATGDDRHAILIDGGDVTIDASDVLHEGTNWGAAV